ncbi:MAG: PaaI family thioesterase [Acidobacteriota bacterium]|nr:PaaI family thioesterase [Acidobacteriota bacterium]
MTTSMNEEIRRVFDAAPFISNLGVELESVGEGTCVTSLKLDERHLQQDGFVHAGVHATLADHSAGVAAATLLREDRLVLSVEFKINLLRAARGERLICRAAVLKPGRRFSVVESEVFCLTDGVERLVSKMTATIAFVSA